MNVIPASASPIRAASKPGHHGQAGEEGLRAGRGRERGACSEPRTLADLLALGVPLPWPLQTHRVRSRTWRQKPLSKAT